MCNLKASPTKRSAGDFTKAGGYYLCQAINEGSNFEGINDVHHLLRANILSGYGSERSVQYQNSHSERLPCRSSEGFTGFRGPVSRRFPVARVLLADLRLGNESGFLKYACLY